jgi:hypothetical protein
VTAADRWEQRIADLDRDRRRQRCTFGARVVGDGPCPRCGNRGWHNPDAPVVGA